MTSCQQHCTEAKISRFSELPIELRLMIWRYTLPGPRKIESGRWKYTEPWFPTETKYLSKETTDPIALSINNESRQLALKYYQLNRRCSSECCRHSFVDFKIDYVLESWLLGSQFCQEVEKNLRRVVFHRFYYLSIGIFTSRLAHNIMKVGATDVLVLLATRTGKLEEAKPADLEARVRKSIQDERGMVDDIRLVITLGYPRLVETRMVDTLTELGGTMLELEDANDPLMEWARA